MTTSPQPCPDCGQPVHRFRSVPGRLGRLFKFRLYSCESCHTVIETSEVVMRIADQQLSKRYVSRIEVNRKPRKEKLDDCGESSSSTTNEVLTEKP